MSENLQFCVCVDQNCHLRFPAAPGGLCPLCGQDTQIAGPRLHRPPRRHPDERTAAGRQSSTRASLLVLLDNVRSIYNVGSIFRSADGAGISTIYLGGITPTPKHRSMRKTALGAHESIAWKHVNNSVRLAASLAQKGHEIWALEQTETSEDIFVAANHKPKTPLVLVLGNEVTGIDPGVLSHCHRQVHIPMYGAKESLNVACAFAIAAYVFVSS